MNESHEEYTNETQDILVSYMLSDADAFLQCQNIIKPEYFYDKMRNAVRYIMEYSSEYRILPAIEQVKAKTGVIVDKFSEILPQHQEWFLKTIENFSRYKALELAVIEGPDMLAEGKGAELEKRVREAMTISLMRDLGTDYFKDPAGRLERMKDRSNYVSTGWKSLDDKLYGGFTRGGLNVFAGGSGSGKSLFLQNISLKWAQMDMHVIYLSLELSEDLVAFRLDSMVSGYTSKQIFTNLADVALHIRTRGLNSNGSLTVKKLPEAGTTANDIRAYLKEYEIKTGRKPEALVIDYLDLMHPNNRKINPSDLFVKDKYTSEEMRAIMGDYDIIGATASQLNRSATEALEFDHSHIAGGISKINTADNVFGIFTSEAMKQRGVYQIQFLKTRSSSAVGSKMEFKYNPSCMLISDTESDTPSQEIMTTQQIHDDLKQKTQIRSEIKEIAGTPATEEAKPSLKIDVMSLIKRNQKLNDL